MRDERIYVEYGEVTVVEGIVRGLGAAVIALVAAAVIRVGGRVIHTLAGIAMAAVAFALIVAGVPFPIVILAAAGAGYLATRPARSFWAARPATASRTPTMTPPAPASTGCGAGSRSCC